MICRWTNLCAVLGLACWLSTPTGAAAQQPAKPVPPPALEISQNTKLDPAKTYGRIVIKQSGITIDGAGASVIGATQGDAKDYKWVGVSATGVSNVTLKNLTVKGWDVGLQIEHGSNWTVENCNFSDNFHYPAWGWGDLGDHGGIVLKYVDHSTFRNNKANRVWDACGLINSDYNVFEKNDFSHTSNTCVWTVTACHNRFTDNNLSWGLRISPGETHARDSCCVLIEYGSDNNYFGHNDITYGGDGVFLRPLNGWISRGNVFEDNDTSYAHNNCIESQSPGNIFRRNKANYGSHGIWIGLSDESVIEDNEACHNGDPKFNRNAGFPMASATFEPKGGAGGIIIIGQCSNTVCRGNKCNSNNGAGVMLWGTPQSKRSKVYHWILDNNEIRDNRIGIYLHLLDWLDMGGNVLDNKENNLIISGTCSNISEHTGDPKITQSPRAVLADGPWWAKQGQPVVFDASKSSDPAGKKLIYRWDVDDGSNPEFQPSVTHAFKDPGFYRVGVTVTNGRFSDLAYRDFRVVDDIPPLGIGGVAGKAADWGFQELAPREGLYWQDQRYIPVGPPRGVDNAQTQVQFSDDKDCTMTGKTSVLATVTPSPACNLISLLYPRTKNLGVSLEGKNYLVFWSKYKNRGGDAGRGLFPVITLYEADQTFAILRPNWDNPASSPTLEDRAEWMYRKIPLHPAPDDKQWKLDGKIPAKLNFITIEFIPWNGAPLRIWFDGLGVR